MEFWMSGEVDADVSTQFLEVLKRIEGPLNDVLKERDYGRGLSEWDFIPVIMNVSARNSYKEIKRYDKKDRSCEFRLHIDHDRFRSANSQQRIELLCRSLLRSLDLLESMRIPDVDVAKLKLDFLQVALSNHWMLVS